MLPTVKLGGADVTRLIIGGNPFSGNSHVNAAMDGEMMDYFTAETIKNTLKDCIKHGINTLQVRGDAHMTRIIREMRLEGYKMNWVAQTAPEIAPYENNIRNIMKYDPIAIYHHGSVTDGLFKEKKFDELKRRLKVIRDTGRAVGIGTHMPEVVEYAEEYLDVDFYMACVYNLSIQDRVSSSLTGKSNEDERFVDADKPFMYAAIQKTKKPCLAFKILGSTRNCGTPEAVAAAFKEGYSNIKPIDAIIVGMFPKYGDQVKENCDIVRGLLQ